MSELCQACGSDALRPHLRVRSEAGPEGLIPTTDRFGSALADIARCTGCGHGQLEDLPTDADLSAAYADAASEDYLEEEAGQRETARRTLERIERRVADPIEGRSLLDLGCWVGFLLAEARSRGWRTHGVEPSAFASAYARERLALDVQTADLFEAEISPRSFDAVVLGDVLEHLPRPAEALDRIAESLAPGGLVCLILPDAGSRVAQLMGTRWWSVLPTHVQYFTRHSLAVLLRRRGFSPLSVATAPKAFSVRYYLDRIGGYSPQLSAALVRAAEAAGLADRMWAPDFRDRMILLAAGPANGSRTARNDP